MEVTWAHRLLQGWQPEGTRPCPSSLVVYLGPGLLNTDRSRTFCKILDGPGTLQWTQGPHCKNSPLVLSLVSCYHSHPMLPKHTAASPLHKGSCSGVPTDPFPKHLHGMANTLGAEERGKVFPDFCSGHTRKKQRSYLVKEMEVTSPFCLCVLKSSRDCHQQQACAEREAEAANQLKSSQHSFLLTCQVWNLIPPTKY